MELDSGKYGHIVRKQADVQHKILQATIAVANEDGERNRLLRIQLAVELIRLSKAERKLIEVDIQEELDLTDRAIE